MSTITLQALVQHMREEQRTQQLFSSYLADVTNNSGRCKFPELTAIEHGEPAQVGACAVGEAISHLAVMANDCMSDYTPNQGGVWLKETLSKCVDTPTITPDIRAKYNLARSTTFWDLVDNTHSAQRCSLAGFDCDYEPTIPYSLNEDSRVTVIEHIAAHFDVSV